MPVKKEYAVLRDWTFSPRPNVVWAFKAGTIAKGIPRRCIIAGIAAKALQPLNAHPALGQGAD